jgi:hypothetical protein
MRGGRPASCPRLGSGLSNARRPALEPFGICAEARAPSSAARLPAWRASRWSPSSGRTFLAAIADRRTSVAMADRPPSRSRSSVSARLPAFAAILAAPPFLKERDTNGLCASAWRGPRLPNGRYGICCRDCRVTPAGCWPPGLPFPISRSLQRRSSRTRQATSALARCRARQDAP